MQHFIFIYLGYTMNFMTQSNKKGKSINNKKTSAVNLNHIEEE
jgi:hypothetical protein